MIIGISGYAGVGKDTVGHIIQWLTSREKYSLLVPEKFEDFYKEHMGKPKALIYYESGGNEPLYAPFEIKKWAGKVKEAASLITGIPAYKFEDQKFKEKELGQEWIGWAVFIKDYEYPELGDIQMTTTVYDEKVAYIELTEIINSLNSRGKSKSVDAYVGEVKMTVRDFLQRLATDAVRKGLHPNTWVNALMSDYSKQYNPATKSHDLPDWVITDTRFGNEVEAIRKKKGFIIRVSRKGYRPVNKHESETAIDNFVFDYRIENNGDMNELISQTYDILKAENII